MRKGAPGFLGGVRGARNRLGIERIGNKGEKMEGDLYDITADGVRRWRSCGRSLKGLRSKILTNLNGRRTRTTILSNLGLFQACRLLSV